MKKSILATILITITFLFTISGFSFADDTWNGNDTSGDAWRTGKVGIGTTIPGQQLTIDGSSPIAEIRSGGYLMLRPTINDFDYRLRAFDYRLGVFSGSNLINPIMTFSHNGSVGIGITDPNRPLHIYKSSSGTGSEDVSLLKLHNPYNALTSDEYGVGIEFQLSTDYPDYKKAEIRAVNSGGWANDIDLTFWSGGSTAEDHQERMRITSTGNVGVGNTNPGSGSISVYGGKVLEVGSNTDGTYGVLDLSANITNNYGAVGVIGFINNNNFDAGMSTRKVIGAISSEIITSNNNVNGDSGGMLKFWTKPEGGTWDDVMIIDSLGHVGIGTISPSEMLHISTGNLIFTNSNNINTTQGMIKFSSPAYTNRYSGIRAMTIAGAVDQMTLSFITSGNSGIPEERMFIDKEGNIGIGTTTPTNKLDVNGTIRAKEVKVESNWSDFVFEKDYSLPSLEHVESYIKENKHLPDIPSAKQVEEEGLSMADMMKKQMQKIEELTLYVIEQNKQIEGLMTKNDELEKRLATIESEK